MLSDHNVVVRMSGILSLLFAVLACPCQGAESTVQQPAKRMELVWSQSDGMQREIYASSYKEGAWTEPVQLTNDDANKLHPVLDVAPDGSKWAFWSAVAHDGISINYSICRNNEWSAPIKVELKQRSAIAPSVLIEDNGTVWLVWAGNDGDDDDIYCSRYANSVWQEAQMINADNEVPDIRPELSRTAQGAIEVSWHGFRDGAYKLLKSTHAAAGWSPEQETEDNQDTDEQETLQAAQIQLPAFLPADSQYFLKVLKN